MSDLLKDPMGNGSKFWAGDILTSLGITVDEAINVDLVENSNGIYYKNPSGLLISFIEFEVSFETGDWQEVTMPAPYNNILGASTLFAGFPTVGNSSTWRDNLKDLNLYDFPTENTVRFNYRGPISNTRGLVYVTTIGI